MGVLYSVLGLIYMSNGVIHDDVLDPFLVKMGLMGHLEHMPPTHLQRGLPRSTAASLGISEEVFNTFGDVKELIRKEWGQKQHYIDAVQVESSEGDAAETRSFQYSWGKRAELEVKKSDLLRMICQLYNCKPSAFKEQYDKIRKEEGENIFAEDEEDADNDDEDAERGDDDIEVTSKLSKTKL